MPYRDWIGKLTTLEGSVSANGEGSEGGTHLSISKTFTRVSLKDITIDGREEICNFAEINQEKLSYEKGTFAVISNDRSCCNYMDFDIILPEPLGDDLTHEGWDVIGSTEGG